MAETNQYLCSQCKQEEDCHILVDPNVYATPATEQTHPCGQNLYPHETLPKGSPFLSDKDEIEAIGFGCPQVARAHLLARRRWVASRMAEHQQKPKPQAMILGKVAQPSCFARMVMPLKKWLVRFLNAWHS